MGLKLYIKIKLRTTTILRINNEDIEDMLYRFCLLGSNINNKQISCQEICHRLAFGKVVKALKFRFCDVSIFTKIRITVFPVTLVKAKAGVWGIRIERILVPINVGIAIDS